MQDWDKYIAEASAIIEVRENYQRKLGELASSVAEEYGSERLVEFSAEIKETYGLIVSPSTLRNYRWVHNKVSKYDLPDDLSYRTLQTIAASGDVEKWAKKIKKEGLSSAEVYKMMMEEKGPVKKKEYMCPHCGGIVELDGK